MSKTRNIEIDAEAVRKIMYDKDITASGVSDFCGRSQQWLSGCLRTGKMPAVAVPQLCRVLGCNDSDIRKAHPAAAEQVRTVDYTDAMNHLARAVGDLDSHVSGIEKQIEKIQLTVENIERVALFNRWALKQICLLMGVTIDDKR